MRRAAINSARLDAGSLPAAADARATRTAALEALRRWHEHAENPAFGRRASDACRVLVRTCEGLVTQS